MRARAELSICIMPAAVLHLMENIALAQPVCDPLKVALEYIARRYPNFDSAGLKRIISERDNLWELTYELPQDTLGGVPIITIDKRSCKIVRAIHTQ